jgi:pimeloyl-ACP methyl ester carboxylesterase
MLRSFDGGRLFGVRYGTKPPWLLALHGWQRSHRDFEGVIDQPAGAASALDPDVFDPGALDAVALDLPGFGASPPPPEPWGSVDYARAVAPVAEELAEALGGPLVVLGHSFGGRVALALAGSRPELVGALVLTGVPHLVQVGEGGRGRAAVPFRVGRALHRGGLLSDARLERLRHRYGSADYRAATGVMRQVLVRTVNERYDEMLAQLECPVELVWGDDDREAPLAVAELAGQRLHRATVTVSPGAGHLTPLTAAPALRAAALRHRPGAEAPEGHRPGAGAPEGHRPGAGAPEGCQPGAGASEDHRSRTAPSAEPSTGL